MNVIFNIVTDVVIWLIIGCVGLGLELVASPSTPYQRGFYCEDTSIRYPYHEDTISTALLTGVGLAIPIVTVFLVEWFLYDKFSKTKKPLYSRALVGKYSFHLMRLSFPSGHASVAFYLLVYWVIYLQQRFVFSPINILRPFLQLVGISLAVLCAETRVSDYKHHPGDVIAGSFLGTIVVIVTVVYVSDLYSKKLTTLPSPEVHDKTDHTETPQNNYGSTVDYNQQMSSVSGVTAITEA